MLFESSHLYHIYNQGNNKQKIFFNENNYLFFLKKIREYILPYAEIIAWCLMPNHFHLMIYIRKEFNIDGATPSHTVNANTRTLNESIGIMLRSYTRAINKQEKRSGALFRETTKAECITKIDGITPSFYNTRSGVKFNMYHLQEEYPQVCFEYIHNNPTSAGLVKSASDWKFSSYNDYYGNRNDSLINRNLAKKFINV